MLSRSMFIEAVQSVEWQKEIKEFRRRHCCTWMQRGLFNP